MSKDTLMIGRYLNLTMQCITHGDINGNKAKKEEIKKVREDLKKYCGLDTEAMILVLNKLRERVEEK